MRSIVGVVLLAGCLAAAFAYESIRLSRLEAALSSINGTQQSDRRQADDNEFSYNDCVIAHVKDTTTNAAAYAVKESCLGKASHILPRFVVDGLGATAWYEPKTAVLHVTIENKSQATLTEVRIIVGEKSGLKTNLYVATLLTHPGSPEIIKFGELRDPSDYRTIPPGQGSFSIAIAETAETSTEFFEKYYFDISAVRGFMD